MSSTAYLSIPSLQIPLITTGILSFCLLSMDEAIEEKDFILFSAGVGTILLIGHQLGSFTPVGPDGWLFFELSQHFWHLGNEPTIDGYLSRPLILIPVSLVYGIIGPAGVIAAVVMTIVLSTLWVASLATALREQAADSAAFVGYFIVGFCGLCLAWYNPAQFSAQLLGIVLAHYFLHQQRERDSRVNTRDRFLLLALSMTHIITVIWVCAVLLVKVINTHTRSRWAIESALLCVGINLIYSAGPAWHVTGVLTDIDSGMSRGLFLLGGAAAIALGPRAADYFGIKSSHSKGTVDLTSLLLGTMVVIPLFLMGDANIGKLRFVPRVMVYSILPLGVLSCRAAEKIRVKYVMKFGARGTNILIVGIIVLTSILPAMAHSLRVERELMLPLDTSECWDLLEESGAGMLVGDLPEAENELHHWILHSPLLRPVNLTFRDNYLALGDATSDRDVLKFPLSVVVETNDMHERLEHAGDANLLDEFTLITSNDACRIWVHNDLTSRPEVAGSFV